MITRRTVRSLVKALFAERGVVYLGEQSRPMIDGAMYVGLSPDRTEHCNLTVYGADLVEHDDRRRFKKMLRFRVARMLSFLGT